MMAVRFFNTLTRRLEEFVPTNPPEVKLYTCGPTVYNYAHIGNFRAYIFEDLLKRYLKFRGYKVFHVMNITDVEDKLIRTCRETGKPLREITDFYIKAFFEDLETLQIEKADVYPRATDHIPEMVEIIKKLMEKGHTYEHKGSIYFRLSTFPEYGKLSHMDIENLKAGASGRVDADEYSIEDARDFALWKAWDEDDGDVFWETELGKGRPGWHIECSAMSMKYLGETFDIHCGGVDNMFPHHENEIAQSECATGKKPFVKYWLHCAHLVVDGKKMSKSLGNFYTLRDLLERGMNPLAIRWVLLATHYRQPNNFTFETVDSAENSLQRIRDFRARLRDEVQVEGDSLYEECNNCENDFIDALDEDLNISSALAVVFDFIRDVNKKIDRREVGQEGAKNVIDLLNKLDYVTGVFNPDFEEVVPSDVMEKVKERQKARRERNYALADAIRDQLFQQGWIVEDTPRGPRVKRK
ncbi:MAG: cysteine--tRNA ligase [Candidatus Hydrogenedentes bacterium]|nr:cysteine--tRNA ligase [Candidatus Hydrogenedentota bacterium]